MSILRVISHADTNPDPDPKPPCSLSPHCCIGVYGQRWHISTQSLVISLFASLDSAQPGFSSAWIQLSLDSAQPGFSSAWIQLGLGGLGLTETGSGSGLVGHRHTVAVPDGHSSHSLV